MDGKRSALKVKVSLIGSLPPLKGISPYMMALTTALASRHDVDVEVLTFRSLYPRWLYPGGDPSGAACNECEIPRARVRRLLTWWNPLSWLIAGLTLRGDVVHAQWWSYFLAPAYVVILAVARLRGKRIVVTVHNVEPHEGGVFRRLANRAVLPWAHVLVVHSERNRQAIEKVAGGRPVRVIPHGALSLSAALPSREEARARLGLPRDAEVVLAFGNIRPYKGLATLIEAFACVRRRRPHARLVIAGQPWGPWEPYQRMIRAHGLDGAATTMLGFIPEETAAALFAAADVVALPYTHFDGQSGVATLALSAGRALVVSNVGGLPELAGHVAAIVAPGAVEELAEALVRVLNDPSLRRMLEASALRKARALSWDAVVASTVGEYRAVQTGRSSAEARAEAVR